MKQNSSLITHEKWMDNVKKLNEGQPSLIDLVQRQIDSYEEENAGENSFPMAGYQEIKEEQLYQQSIEKDRDTLKVNGIRTLFELPTGMTDSEKLDEIYNIVVDPSYDGF
ncbi:hypothetical protein BEH_11630 [Priestia filamentosa]|uniref:Uncharacterized protein n=1 Tax=Priestia filamentosa TaxID=1402861 RepID=A0A0H4KIR6_9BACI|nr:hypothetical protein [Priestia filamentosa]AKO92686.1 hypothetical protein BEH_11630 [Priestia filamentosa]